MSSAAKRVLVVDNSAVVRHSISAMLLRIGCQISEAEAGDEALKLIASQPPDLVILDLYMPKDGFETLAEIRANPAHQDLTVFILTRTASPDFVRRAASLGVTDYLVKFELNPRDLRTRLGQALGIVAGESPTSGETSPLASTQILAGTEEFGRAEGPRRTAGRLGVYTPAHRRTVRSPHAGGGSHRCGPRRRFRGLRRLCCSWFTALDTHDRRRRPAHRPDDPAGPYMRSARKASNPASRPISPNRWTRIVSSRPCAVWPTSVTPRDRPALFDPGGIWEMAAKMQNFWNACWYFSNVTLRI